MAGLNNAGKALRLAGFAGGVAYVSLHTADPGSGGANEVTGGSPAYARKSIGWAAPASGSVASNTAQVFDVPGGGTTITHGGYWSAPTGGTFYGSRALDSPQTFATQGTYTLASGGVVESDT